MENKDLRILYISPEYEHDKDSYMCSVSQAAAGASGIVNIMLPYPKFLFEKHFHGTLTAFCKDWKIITDVKTIKELFNVRYEYVIELNLINHEMIASDGKTYSFSNNMFCLKNRNTYATILSAMRKCNTCYIQLIIDDRSKSGEIIDITLIENPENKGSGKFAYDKKLNMGFIGKAPEPVKRKHLFKRKTDEKMIQEEINEALNKLYFDKTLEGFDIQTAEQNV